MKTKILFWIMAIILLLVNLAIEFIYQKYSGLDTIILNTLTLISIATGSGLLVALIPFRKTKYLDRIYWTIPFGIFALYIIIVAYKIEYYNGFFERYNYFSAKQDLQNGKIQLIINGELADTWEQQNKVAKEYDLDIVWMGCIIHNKGYLKYNEVMVDYLKQKYGQQWAEDFHKHVLTLYEAENHKSPLPTTDTNKIDTLQIGD